MKNTMTPFLPFLPFLLCFSLSAQDKYGDIWILGYPPNNQSQKFGGTKLDFTGGQGPVVSFQAIPAETGPCTTMSDANGNFMYYANGCAIVTNNFEWMDNGESFNEGYIHDQYCDDNFSYPWFEGIISFPKINEPNVYQIYYDKLNNKYYPTELHMAEIDMNQNNGLGKVTIKDSLVFQDTLFTLFSATRHGNGRDWWLVIPKSYSEQGFFTFLLDPAGLHLQQYHNFSDNLTYAIFGFQSEFSMDGSRYARISGDLGDLWAYQFDRCSGLLYNPQELWFEDTLVDLASVCFSPNGRYLYASNVISLYQFDMEAPDVQASRVKIVDYMDYASTHSTGQILGFMKNGPDGKIYINSASEYFHIIQQPNLPGTLCQFEHHALEMPTYTTWDVPNSCNYKLYDLAGSPCDTLGIDGPHVSVHSPSKWAKGMDIFPNPANEILNLRFGTMLSGMVQITDLAGKVMVSMKVTDAIGHDLGIGHLARGIYTCTFLPEGGVPQSKLFVKYQD